MFRLEWWWQLTGSYPYLQVSIIIIKVLQSYQIRVINSRFSWTAIPHSQHFDISVFVNKTLLSGQDKIDAPLFVTWYQCIVTVLACYLIRQVARYFPARVSFPELQLDSHVMKQVTITNLTPLSVFTLICCVFLINPQNQLT